MWRRRSSAASLDAFAAAGLTHAALDVDSSSPTGAARLYRSLGFETAARSVASRLERM